MPLSQINPDFLKETEREALDQQKPIGVQFVEPSNKVYMMVLRQWYMPKESGKKSSSYVLRINWNNAVAANDLKITTVVQIWSFRVANQEDLCMALVVVDKEGSKSSGNSNDREGGSNSS
ncbi:B3 domain-containing protein At2g31420-like [Quercus lobata]|uniref:B3 domain-containing protein At2g31420-like n=1 Tax=Quercus lobata TaxID=97700 RepID=UPI001245D359|nr:B3 domain-containing protein At2g31420-like [Quercus lobata]